MQIAISGLTDGSSNTMMIAEDAARRENYITNPTYLDPAYTLGIANDGGASRPGAAGAGASRDQGLASRATRRSILSTPGFKIINNNNTSTALMARAPATGSSSTTAARTMRSSRSTRAAQRRFLRWPRLVRSRQHQSRGGRGPRLAEWRRRPRPTIDSGSSILEPMDGRMFRPPIVPKGVLRVPQYTDDTGGGLGLWVRRLR